MFRIDAEKCNGCGACVVVCPQKAISLIGNAARINTRLCKECSKCIEVCATGAIHEVVKVPQAVGTYREITTRRKGKEVIEMPYRYGYRMGFGFRGASPSWPYVGRGRGGLPRCWYPGLYSGPGYTPPPPPPYYAGAWGTPYAGISREDEMGFLREEANAIKTRLDEIEARIKELEKEEK